MEPARARDPFAVTADPQAYVPRAASEAALEELEGALRRGATCVALTGPPGVGKTMLLRVLERRLADTARCVYLPYAALGFDDLCRWVLGLLGEAPGAQAGSPAARMRAAAAGVAQQGRFLLVLLDDASALPPETARAWVALAGEAQGALRLLAVPVDDGRAGRVVAALGPELVAVRYSAPLAPCETEAFVRGRLKGAGVAPEIQARFDEPLLARLHGAAAGNPWRLQRLATKALRRLQSPDAGPEELELELDDEWDELDPLLDGARDEPAVLSPREGAAREARSPASERARGRHAAPERADARGAAGAAADAAGRRPSRGGASRRLAAVVLAALLVGVTALALRTGGPGLEEQGVQAASAPAAPAPAAQRPEAAAPPPPAEEDPISVHINAVPWAFVSVDGRALGATPLANVPLPPGPRHFRAELPDGTVLERTVEIGPAQRHLSFAADDAPSEGARP